MHIISNLENELKTLLEDNEQLEAMAESYIKSKKKFDTDVQEFMTRHFGFAPGKTFTLLEVIKKAKGL
jgi:hypothetical protein